MKQKTRRLLAFSTVLFMFACAQKNTPKESMAINSLKVLTYNVHHCNPPDKPGIIDVDAIAAEVKQQKADVAAIQEVDVHTNRSGKINQAELLATKAGFSYYHFGKAIDYDGGQYGILVLSQYPIRDTATYLLPKSDPLKGGEQRVLAAATIQLPDGKSFRFGSTHLEAYNKISRELQAKEIGRIATSSSIPFIVAGDFNAREGSEVIRIFDEHFTRTCQNCPSTFGENGETGAIDFITFTPKAAFTVMMHEVIQNHEASDHMPVVAQLRFQSSSQK